MPSRTLPGLGLNGYWALGEDGWKDQMDSNWLLLSVLGARNAISRTTALPGSPSAGDVYIVPSGAGANPNQIAVYDGESGSEAWVYITPTIGQTLYVIDDGADYRWNGSAWALVVTGVGGGGATAFTGLSDTPADYASQAGRYLAVNPGEDGLVFVDAPVGGGGVGGGDLLPYARFTPPTSAFVTGEGSSVNGAISFNATTQRVRVELGAPRTASGVYFALEPVTAATDFVRIYRVSLHVSAELASFIGVSVKNSANGRSINFGKFTNNNDPYYSFYLDNAFQAEGVHDVNEAGLRTQDQAYLKVERVGNDLTFGVSRDGILWAESVVPFNITTDNSLGDIDRVGFFLQETALEADDVVALEVLGRDTSQQAPARASNVGNTQQEIATATYSTVSADFSGDKVKKWNSATGCTVTVEPGMESTEPCTFIQTGTGQITFAAGAGVTINSPDGHLLTRVRFSSAVLIPDKGVADTYYLTGDIAT